MEKNKIVGGNAFFINVISMALLLLIGKGHLLASDAPEQFHAAQNQIEQLITKGEVPSLAIAVARDGKIIWERGFGLADKEKNIPATEHTKYALASISKPLTATGLMILVERELVNLDRPINEYLGAVKLYARVGGTKKATVRRVASHTSGLPLHSQHFYDNELTQPPPMDETIRRYGNLVTAPGERYQYSNLGYGLLGYVISRASGKSYADFMCQEVFIPLGMDLTSVNLGKSREDGQAVNYAPDGSIVPLYSSDSPGAGSIVSSAHDLIRFAMFHLKNNLTDQKAIITESTIEKMQIPSPETGPLEEWEFDGSGYGIGWVISMTKENLRAVRHNGGTIGVIQGKLETADVNRGKPYKLWLELKLRENALNGSLIAFSQSKFYTGPLTYWVELNKNEIKLHHFKRLKPS